MLTQNWIFFFIFIFFIHTSPTSFKDDEADKPTKIPPGPSTSTTNIRPVSVLKQPGSGKGDQELLDGAEQGNLEKVKALIEAHKDDPLYINGSDKMGATGNLCL